MVPKYQSISNSYENQQFEKNIFLKIYIYTYMSRQDIIRCYVSVPRIPMSWDVPSMTLQLAKFWDVSLVIPQLPLFSADVFMMP